MEVKKFLRSDRRVCLRCRSDSHLLADCPLLRDPSSLTTSLQQQPQLDINLQHTTVAVSGRKRAATNVKKRKGAAAEEPLSIAQPAGLVKNADAETQCSTQRSKRVKTHATTATASSDSTATASSDSTATASSDSTAT
eukprot:Lankesteria_metandrocarpae@DN1311_c0_g1_i1.p1